MNCIAKLHNLNKKGLAYFIWSIYRNKVIYRRNKNDMILPHINRYIICLIHIVRPYYLFREKQ